MLRASANRAPSRGRRSSQRCSSSASDDDGGFKRAMREPVSLGIGVDASCERRQWRARRSEGAMSEHASSFAKSDDDVGPQRAMRGQQSSDKPCGEKHQ
jgi:hypothetical protein